MMKTIVPKHLDLPSMVREERQYHYNFTKKSFSQEKVFSFDFTFIHNGQTNDEPKRSVIKINRNNLLINKEKPDGTLISELLYHSSQALFPLRLSLNSYGYPKNICNHADIVERWKSFIPRFKPYYEGEKAIKLLNRIGKIYRNEDYLLDSLRKDVFFSVYFFPIYGDYGVGRVTSIEGYEFCFNSGQKIKYTLDLEIINEFTENGKIKIMVKGKSNVKEDDTVSGYFLLNKDRTIHEIKMDFFFVDYNEEINIQIFETKEIAERKSAFNVVYDEKEESEKLMKSRGFFIEEIESDDVPKHK
ncbi:MULTISPECIES: hypothetical protein [unclassified Chryseobacterium]|uniref:hypothetical protein n=1 Tax=unclassified Chryseobacterium TaxID=2593645 RepID=UPI00226AB089|nr:MULTISPECIES: hypothetical protein [unclassified Chryseobacterium]